MGFHGRGCPEVDALGEIGCIRVSNSTLTSLAMLKVQTDRGHDYLDYLRPFVLQVLADHNRLAITDSTVRELVLGDFGLDIPERTIHLVLRRLSRVHPIHREYGVYRIEGDLPDPGIGAKKAQAERHINSIVSGLKQYAEAEGYEAMSKEAAGSAVIAFLSRFDVISLRAYLRGTAIPEPEVDVDSSVVLVSRYVVSLQESNPAAFDSLLVVVTGHMLANALLCPDLSDAPRSFNKITFFLDTPVVIRRLGLEGEPQQAAASMLVQLLRDLGGRVSMFVHSRDELEHVLRSAMERVDSGATRSAIVAHCRRRGITKSDLSLVVDQLDEKLAEAGIDVLDSPAYSEDSQIDELRFEEILDAEVSYWNPRARRHDVNSVRSIYAIRGRSRIRNLETAKAVLVTSNSAFSRAAYLFGAKYEQSGDVSSVLTDFTLANIAWLKAPMAAPSIPRLELLAFAYAALEPPTGLMEKFLREVDRLEMSGAISPRDHQLLRSSQIARDELMRLTLGAEAAVTPGTVTSALDRITSEISSEERAKLDAEALAHSNTARQLVSERQRLERVQRAVYLRCVKRAAVLARGVSAVTMLLSLAGVAWGLGLRSEAPVIAWLLVAGASVFGVLTLVSTAAIVVGFGGWTLQNAIRGWALGYCLRREASALEIDVVVEAQTS